MSIRRLAPPGRTDPRAAGDPVLHDGDICTIWTGRFQEKTALQLTIS